MNGEGYILTMQHDGPAHAEGWPFPGWHISGGVGWHFRPIGVSGYDVPLVGPEEAEAALEEARRRDSWHLEDVAALARLHVERIELDEATPSEK